MRASGASVAATAVQHWQYHEYSAKAAAATKGGLPKASGTEQLSAEHLGVGVFQPQGTQASVSGINAHLSRPVGLHVARQAICTTYLEHFRDVFFALWGVSMFCNPVVLPRQHPPGHGQQQQQLPNPGLVQDPKAECT